MNNSIKITVEAHNSIYTVEVPDESTAEDLTNHFAAIMLHLTYSTQAIMNTFRELDLSAELNPE